MGFAVSEESVGEGGREEQETGESRGGGERDVKENLMNGRTNKKAIPNLIALLVFMRRRVKGNQQWDQKEEVEKLKLRRGRSK